jgi:uncharacterized protein YnzC (UPF0291/DUF896 family)
MTEKKIKRINELASKSKQMGLTDEEKAEQELLRREFIDGVLGNVRSQLEMAGRKPKPGKKDK